MIGILKRLINQSAIRAKEEHVFPGAVRIPKSLSGLSPGKKKIIEDGVILGVLLGCVAYADNELSEEEEKAIFKVLIHNGSIPKEEAALVLAAAHESREHRPDIQGFTREIAKKPYKQRMEVLKLLFLVAFADQSLSHMEMETIRKISKLLWITHKDFIKLKLERASKAK